MRVAILGAFSLQDNRISGGPEAVVVQLADGLRRLPGMDVHVFTASSRVDRDSVQQREGVTVHTLRLRRVPRWTLVRANARALAQAVRRIAPDVAHAHSGGTWGDAALGSGAPAVITVHGVIRQEAQVFRRYGLTWRESLSWRYEEWYERRGLARAADVIAISPYVADFYRSMTAARMHLVENPVADAYFDLPDATEPGVILCAGRIIRRKNVLGLLQAFAELHRSMPEARLRLAGDEHSEPEYAAQCRLFVAEQGLGEAVSFLGWLDEPAMQAEYSRCACLALPSWQETAPVAIEQAMAAGKVVVASNVGGVPHLLANGQAGLLVQPDDSAGLAAALRLALQDDALRQRLGQAARREADQRFRTNVVARQTVAVYEEIIAQRLARS
ncbi:MAG TPA: glycosyltransferase family 4 protein [Anaerolineae bacterium]|nr:glycosyltransferase family 4 protein [Anaerolineae bacterium]